MPVEATVVKWSGVEWCWRCEVVEQRVKGVMLLRCGGVVWGGEWYRVVEWWCVCGSAKVLKVTYVVVVMVW